MRSYTLYKIARPFITLYMKIFYKVQIIGNENINKNESTILVGNHTNNLDSLLIISSTKRNIRFLAKKELFKGLFKSLFLKSGLIPVDRNKKNPEAKEIAKKALENNEVICIFPEGTINRTENIILPFKYGAVSLASKTNSSLTPFVIKGKYKLFKKSITITYLKPYKLENDLEKENKKLMSLIKGELKNEILV